MLLCDWNTAIQSQESSGVHCEPECGWATRTESLASLAAFLTVTGNSLRTFLKLVTVAAFSSQSRN